MSVRARWKPASVFVAQFLLLAGLVAPASAAATDVLASSTDPVDVGLINEQVEDTLPDVIDEWPDISVGGCGVTGSSVSKSGVFISGSGSVSCSGVQRVATVEVCIQRRTADRWAMLAESCRMGAGTGGSASATASTVCTPGTWKYRLYVTGIVVGGTTNVVANKVPGTRIACPIAAEENP